ncbi:hypothetical protein EW026_g7818 [Hermanssonia centrifuga]|uniref:Fungal-type protein kinase domain-containing protein n=1 Tax=Hermanssonia centrifuga TaxID=98765 RepID=A0A4S4K6I4_9APHY|nr:hypothetical protein EW026_g7818 [Hermanssonia centrifuga]
MKAECLIDVDHTKETVDPYILEDVDSATREPFKVWLEAVLGLPEEKFSDWVHHITEKEWYKDEIIQKGLIEFSNASAETERYEPFARIANRILELGKDGLPGAKSYPLNDITIVRNDPTYLNRIPEHSGLGAKRKPDLLAVRARKVQLLEEAKSKAFDWSDILTFVEMKHSNNLFHQLQVWRTTTGNAETEPQSEPDSLLAEDDEDDDPTYDNANRKRARDQRHGCDPSDAKKPRNDGDLVKAEVKLQAGGYALETAACTYGTRLFTTGIILEDDKTSLWYYDAAGIIRTQEALSLLHDFEEIAAILIGFASCEPSQWGSLPPSIVKPPKSSPYPESFPPNNLKGYTLEMTPPEGGRKVRLTLQDPIFTQYSLIGRRTFLYAIKTTSRKLKKPMLPEKLGVGHLPEVHMWGDFWKMSEGVRAIFFERCGPDHEYEDRVFRGIVYSQYFPLKDLFSKSWELIPTMVYQMLDCLHDLRYKAKILHRDISANNVMWEMQGDEVIFKLIDFDFAAFVDDEGRPAATTPSSKHRTGTLAFMAYELVDDMIHRNDSDYEPIVHLLCHDFQSLFYVSAYSMIIMPEVKDTVKRGLYRKTVWLWENGSMDQIAGCKALLWDSCKIEKLPMPPQCEPLRPWLLLFSDIMQGARSRFRSHRKNKSELFDQETVGGVLTRDAIKNTLMEEVGYKSIYPSRDKSSVPPKASGSGASNLATVEEKETKTKAKKAAPASKAPVKKDTAKGKKVATAKIVTPKKIAAAKAYENQRDHFEGEAGCRLRNCDYLSID